MSYRPVPTVAVVVLLAPDPDDPTRGDYVGRDCYTAAEIAKIE